MSLVYIEQQFGTPSISLYQCTNNTPVGLQLMHRQCRPSLKTCSGSILLSFQHKSNFVCGRAEEINPLYFVITIFPQTPCSDLHHLIEAINHTQKMVKAIALFVLNALPQSMTFKHGCLVIRTLLLWDFYMPKLLGARCKKNFSKNFF